MIITQIRFNWRQEGNVEGGISENWNVAEVGKCLDNDCRLNPIVLGIIDMVDDRGYCFEIGLADGTKQRVFNPNRVYYASQTTNSETLPSETGTNLQES